MNIDIEFPGPPTTVDRTLGRSIWESDTVAELDNQHSRSGTWACMSGILLEYPLKPNELADDIESLIHVFTLSLLRHHVHSLSIRDADGNYIRLALHVGMTYDYCERTPGGYLIGGHTKIEHMLSGHPGFQLDAESNHPELVHLLTKLYRLARLHYSKLDWKQLQISYGVTRIPQPVLPAYDKNKEEPEYYDTSDFDMGAIIDGPDPSAEDAEDEFMAEQQHPIHSDLLATPHTNRIPPDDVSETTPDGNPSVMLHPSSAETAPAETKVELPPERPPDGVHRCAEQSCPNELALLLATAKDTQRSPDIPILHQVLPQLALDDTGDFNTHEHILNTFLSFKPGLRWKRDKFADHFEHLSTLTLRNSKRDTEG